METNQIITFLALAGCNMETIHALLNDASISEEQLTTFVNILGKTIGYQTMKAYKEVKI